MVFARVVSLLSLVALTAGTLPAAIRGTLPSDETVRSPCGASVCGWVTGDAPDVDIRGAKVRLVREDPSLPRGGTDIASAEVSERGFFQLEGVAAGAYVLVAERKGLSPARASVTVVEGEAQLLEAPLVLRPLAVLEVLITPAVAPGGGPWDITLSRLVPNATSLRRVAREPASEMGRWLREGLEPGMYFVSIREGSTTFETRQLAVEPRMPPLLVHVPLVEVRGEVRAGDEPLRARLRLDSTSAGAHVTVETDDGGGFRAFLPKEGTWDVDGELVPSRQSFRREVEVRRRDGAEFARVDLVLPPGRIEGRVVDEEGNGVPAAVNLTRNSSPVSETMAGSDGRFELVGIEEGPASISAWSKGRDSGTQSIAIGDATQFVTLTLREELTIAGTLRTTDGRPIAGASMRYASGAMGMKAPAETTPRGAFELQVPAASRTVSLVIVSPSLPTRLVTLAIDRAGKRLDVVIPPAGGHVVIRLGNTPPWPILSRDGAAASLSFLVRPRLGSPPEWADGGNLLHLEPGDYTLCPGVAATEQCRTVTVVPGGRTIVDVTAWGGKR